MFYITDKQKAIEVAIDASPTKDQVEAVYFCTLRDPRNYLRYFITIDGVEYGVVNVGLIGLAVGRLHRRKKAANGIWWKVDGKWQREKPEGSTPTV